MCGLPRKGKVCCTIALSSSLPMLWLLGESSEYCPLSTLQTMCQREDYCFCLKMGREWFFCLYFVHKAFSSCCSINLVFICTKLFKFCVKGIGGISVLSSQKTFISLKLLLIFLMESGINQAFC